jgi:L-malate glycosyltransferase
MTEDRPVPAGVREVVWRGKNYKVHWYDWPGLRQDLHRVMQEILPDVVHAGPVQSSAFLTALTGFKPLVTMSWGSDLLVEADKSRLMRYISHFTLRRSEVLIADCQVVSDKAQTLGFPADRIVQFPWGVDLNTFKPGETGDLRRRLGWEDKFVLLCLRSWEPIYGVDLVTRAFVSASKVYPNFRLILLGGGSQAGLIQKIIKDGGAEERVYWGGQVSNDDLPQFYRTADLYLSASHSDGSSVSLMEALASGLPALVSNIGGNREWVSPGENGWLFPDGDENALSRAIVQAFEVREKLVPMKLKARRVAEQRADWSQNIQNLFRAYDLAVSWAIKRKENG